MPEDTAVADTTFDAGSTQVDTQVDQSAPAVDAAPDASTPVDTPQGQQTDSLTPPTPVRAPTSGTPPAQAPVTDPTQEAAALRSRYDELRSYANRVANENQTFRKQWDGLDPQRVRELMADHEKREKASKLNPWNSGHPEYSKFQSVQQRAQTFQRLQQSADTPEKQALLKDMLATQFAPEEIRLMQEAETDRRQRMEQFHSDPVGFVNQLIEPLMQQKLAEFDQFMGARTSASQLLSDPGNQALIQRYAPEMAQIMDGKIPARELAFEHARMKAELETLKQRLGDQVETESMADAQNAARRGPGRPPGSPNRPKAPTAPARDPIAVLADRKIYPGDPQFARELHKLNNPQR